MTVYSNLIARKKAYDALTPHEYQPIDSDNKNNYWKIIIPVIAVIIVILLILKRRKK